MKNGTKHCLIGALAFSMALGIYLSRTPSMENQSSSLMDPATVAQEKSAADIDARKAANEPATAGQTPASLATFQKELAPLDFSVRSDSEGGTPKGIVVENPEQNVAVKESFSHQEWDEQLEPLLLSEINGGPVALSPDEEDEVRRWKEETRAQEPNPEAEG